MSATAAMAAADAREAGVEREELPVAESVHAFGEGLVGVLARPADELRGRAALILLNAGLVHRSGPFRLHVQLARRLAAQGFAVFRFDQSGKGDSPLSPKASEGRKHDEIAAAMDLVTQLTGVGGFVLGGVCSGADDAFNVAPRDDRVSGMLLLDGVGYRTRGYHLRHNLPRLFRPAALWRYAKRRLTPAAPDTSASGFEDYRDFPPQAEARARLEALDARGVDMLMLYTGGVGYYYNHRRQAEECFGPVMRSPRITTDYWPECDHTYYARTHREKLLAIVTGWMLSRFSAPSASQ